MKKYAHLRAKAIKFREKGMSLPDICERLGMTKGTVWYWIKDVESDVPTTKQQTAAARAAGQVTKEKFAKLRKEAYDDGYAHAPKFFQDARFRDFVVLYLTEGYRRSRNSVSLANSNENIMKLGHEFIKNLTERKIRYQLQCHVDNDEEKIKKHWGKVLGIKWPLIKTIRKSNSGDMTFRNWRSKYGVLSVETCDTYFRSRLQAWMDYLQEQWK